jgi:hypothetical protein
MKIRNGFVSNSSSTAFVFIGLLFSKKCDAKIDEIINFISSGTYLEGNKEFNTQYGKMKYISGSDDGVPRKYSFGIGELFYIDIDSDDTDFPIVDLIKNLNELLILIKSKYSEVDIDIKLISGIRCT